MITSIILDNVRSAHNVGSIIRTADGFGVASVVSTGITPYIIQERDARLPHIANKATKDIAKTALGAEGQVSNQYSKSTSQAILTAKESGLYIIAIEQTRSSKPIGRVKLPGKCAVVFGNEVTGISQDCLDLCDEAAEIPMNGKKESFNVSVSVGIALYALSE